jgi:hypothetical protein
MCSIAILIFALADWTGIVHGIECVLGSGVFVAWHIDSRWTLCIFGRLDEHASASRLTLQHWQMMGALEQSTGCSCSA